MKYRVTGLFVQKQISVLVGCGNGPINLNVDMLSKYIQTSFYGIIETDPVKNSGCLVDFYGNSELINVILKDNVLIFTKIYEHRKDSRYNIQYTLRCKNTESNIYEGVFDGEMTRQGFVRLILDPLDEQFLKYQTMY